MIKNKNISKKWYKLFCLNESFFNICNYCKKIKIKSLYIFNKFVAIKSKVISKVKFNKLVNSV